MDTARNKPSRVAKAPAAPHKGAAGFFTVRQPRRFPAMPAPKGCEQRLRKENTPLNEVEK